MYNGHVSYKTNHKRYQHTMLVIPCLVQLNQTSRVCASKANKVNVITPGRDVATDKARRRLRNMSTLILENYRQCFFTADSNRH